MVIRKVNNYTFDLFMSGQYWDDWSRVRLNKDGSISTIGGRRLNKGSLIAALEGINAINSN